MARFVRGDVVVVPFPFSNLTQAKRRPALVVTSLEGDDVILCQITSKTVSDTFSLPLDESGQKNSMKLLKKLLKLFGDRNDCLYFRKCGKCS